MANRNTRAGRRERDPARGDAGAVRAPGPQEAPSQTARDSLAERAHELEGLRAAEHDSVFGGDQREMSGELSTVDQHPADVADFTYQRELQATTGAILGREEAQVHEAMRRREAGQYGTCARCGRPIPPERLAARPQATLCVECQRKVETGRGS